MNAFYNGSCLFSVKIEEVSCFYFCSHFYDPFKKKRSITNFSILQSHPQEEVIASCCKYKEKIRYFYPKLDSLSDIFFQ